MSTTNQYTLVTGARTPVLRAVAQPVAKITKDIKKFCDVILDKMYEYNGV